MTLNSQPRKFWNLSNISDLEERVAEYMPAPKMRARQRVDFSVGLAFGILVAAGAFFIGHSSVASQAGALPLPVFTIAQGVALQPPPLESFFASERPGFSEKDEAKLLSELDNVSFTGWTASDDDVLGAVAANLEEKISSHSAEDVRKMLGRRKRA
jgi:hypothetical protein